MVAQPGRRLQQQPSRPLPAEQQPPPPPWPPPAVSAGLRSRRGLFQAAREAACGAGRACLNVARRLPNRSEQRSHGTDTKLCSSESALPNEGLRFNRQAHAKLAWMPGIGRSGFGGPCPGFGRHTGTHRARDNAASVNLIHCIFVSVVLGLDQTGRHVNA